MRKIKNDPSTYQKRSDLGPKQRARLGGDPAPKPTRDDWFLTARIDEGGFVDFRKAHGDEVNKPRE